VELDPEPIEPEPDPALEHAEPIGIQDGEDEHV